MTNSMLDVRQGAQRPRVASAPASVSSAGGEAVELAAAAGLKLDPWQAHVLDVSLGERADGKWSAFEVGLMVPRQNGKGSVLEARELAGLFLFDERLILHSAHEFKTAQEAFRRVLTLVENTDALRKQVARVRTSHGEEGIELRNGARLRFVARSTGSGRGFSGDLVILDEAYNLSADSMAALLPTLSARPNPQLWYTSSAGMESSDQLAKVRERGRLGNDPSLAYFEWSAAPDADLDDPEAWAQANPAMGARIFEEFVGRERAALDDREFARERLGIWADARRDTVIDMGIWQMRADTGSKVLDPVAFALDVKPDRSSTSISLAGARDDDKAHVEVVQTGEGTSWVVPRLLELVEAWNPCVVVVDPGSAAGSLLTSLREGLERIGSTVEVLETTARDVAQACGQLFDAVKDDDMVHYDQPSLNAALMGAKKRPLGDAWAWDRKKYDSDITPLVATTLALWGFNLKKAEVTDLAASVW